MIVEKEAKIANFNLVIGQDEPMLEYFDTLVFPAFTSGIIKKEKDAEYTFSGVSINHSIENDYVLVGKIVKKTVLEIKSDLNEKGELIEKDELYSSAPYSTFVIYLRNHRMMLVPNQKGSPTLGSFRSTSYYLLNEYRKRINSKEENQDKIPELDLTVVGIPSALNIKEILGSVDKVNELKLKFYPLNGDIDMTGLFSSITSGIREVVGSKRGEIVLRSPKNMEGITKVLEESAGTVEPIITSTTKEKTKIRIREADISEKHKLKLRETKDFKKENQDIIDESARITTLKYTNKEHDNIYERNLSRIKKYEFNKYEGSSGG